MGLLAAAWVFRADRKVTPLCIVGIAALAAVLSRIALLSYLEVTTIRSLFTLYLAPATPFVAIFVVVGNWLGVRAAYAVAVGLRHAALPLKRSEAPAE